MAGEAWDAAGAYDAFMGRWSRRVAAGFLAWLDLPRGGRWLDVGCGTGALAAAALRTGEPASLHGVDPSAAYVRHACDALNDPRARFVAGDAAALPFARAAFDAVVSGLVLNFVPAPAEAVAEMARVARPGAVVGAYVWDYAGKMQILRRFWDAAFDVDPASARLDQGSRSPLCAPEPLASLLTDAGLSDVEVRAIDVVAHFRDFDDYWSPFLGGQGGAPGYIATLSEEQRDALRDAVRARIDTAADGSIDLIARAWAARAAA